MLTNIIDIRIKGMDTSSIVRENGGFLPPRNRREFGLRSSPKNLMLLIQKRPISLELGDCRLFSSSSGTFDNVFLISQSVISFPIYDINTALLY